MHVQRIHKSAFTVGELLVIIMVIGILASTSVIGNGTGAVEIG